MSWTPGKGFQSDSNNTTTNLGSGVTFTGTSELNYEPDVMVSCFSDTAGTLYFDFANVDGNWRTYPTDGFSVAAGVHEFHIAVKGPRYFRVRFINGSVAQTDFELYTYFGDFKKATAPYNQPIGLDFDAQLVRGTWPWLDVARSLVNGIVSIKKFGRNASIATSFVPLALGGVYRTPQSGSAATLRVKAGNANDTAAGTGAREVTLIGTDENFDEIEVSLATAGASASSATAETFTRIYRAFVSGSGTYATQSAGSHADDIVIEKSDGTEDWLTIDATDISKGQSEVGCYTIPRNKTGYVKIRNLSANTGKTIDLVFFHRPNADQTSPPYSAMRSQSVVTGLAGGSIETFGLVEVPFGPYQGPTDIGFMGKISSGSGGSIAIEFEIFLISEV